MDARVRVEREEVRGRGRARSRGSSRRRSRGSGPARSARRPGSARTSSTVPSRESLSTTMTRIGRDGRVLAAASRGTPEQARGCGRRRCRRRAVGHRRVQRSAGTQSWIETQRRIGNSSYGTSPRQRLWLSAERKYVSGSSASRASSSSSSSSAIPSAPVMRREPHAVVGVARRRAATWSIAWIVQPPVAGEARDPGADLVDRLERDVLEHRDRVDAVERARRPGRRRGKRPRTNRTPGIRRAQSPSSRSGRRRGRRTGRRRSRRSRVARAARRRAARRRRSRAAAMPGGDGADDRLQHPRAAARPSGRGSRSRGCGRRSAESQ